MFFGHVLFKHHTGWTFHFVLCVIVQKTFTATIRCFIRIQNYVYFKVIVLKGKFTMTLWCLASHLEALSNLYLRFMQVVWDILSGCIRDGINIVNTLNFELRCISWWLSINHFVQIAAMWLFMHISGMFFPVIFTFEKIMHLGVLVALNWIYWFLLMFNA